MKYQPHIDGLRSVAVVPVLLFHAGWTVIGGGFVGVDVFFVISGYLITGIIAREIEEGRFSIVGFYERRIRRIVPALFAVLAVVLAGSAALFLPDDLMKQPSAVVGAVGFFSNIVFFYRTNYFIGGSRTEPLLHTWSLAIEEQFYLVLPLLLVGLAALWAGRSDRRRRTLFVVAAVTAASLALNLATAYNTDRFAYYFAPPRLWEMLVGSLLALIAIPEIRPRPVRELLAAAGLVAICYAILFFDREMAYPGLAALVPVIGTALVLLAAPGTLTGRLLSQPPAVWIGLISYSLYLWHWPIIVFWEYFHGIPPNRWSIIVTFLASFPIAWLSWRYIEQPFRRPGRGGAIGRHPFIATAAGGAALVLGAAALLATNGWPGRFPAEAVRVASYANSRDFHARDCAVAEAGCIYGARVAPATAVWGDSHASALVGAIGEVAARHNQSVVQYAKLDCPPVVGKFRATRRCHAFAGSTLARLTQPDSPHTVILIAHLDATKRRTDKVFMAAMADTIAKLERAGKRVVVSFPLPAQPTNVPVALAQAVTFGRSMDVGLPRATYYQRNAQLLRFMESVGSERVIRIRTDRLICRDERCKVMLGRDVLVRDASHPTLEGSRYLATLFEPLFEDGP